eukprot:8039394-Ditylum_brightwellii.AAC.2
MSKTVSDARQNFVGAGDEPNGSRSNAIAKWPTIAMHAAAIHPHVWSLRYALSMSHLWSRM